MKTTSHYLLLLLAICACTMTSCLWPAEVIIPDPDPVEEPLVVDTCESLELVTAPAFVTLYTEYFNGVPTTGTYYWNAGQGHDIPYTSLKEALVANGYPADSITVYEEGSSIAAVIRGTNDTAPLRMKVWARDAAGQKAFLTANSQAFIFAGALTFEEFHQVAKDLPSVAIFNFRNTNWTQEQYEEVASLICGCKLGRREANFMFNAHPISDELYCLFIARGWMVVRGQIENCPPPPPLPVISVDRA